MERPSYLVNLIKMLRNLKVAALKLCSFETVILSQIERGEYIST